VSAARPVVAIDGAAGSGKSTLARSLARALGMPYLNTGLMYRALTLEAIERGLDLEDGDALADLTRELRFSLAREAGAELRIGGSRPSAELEGERVEANVSRVSAHRRVRAVMRELQRELGLAGAVVEGRDIGSVVFPEAPVKLFLDADPRARAGRRAEERGRDERVEGSLYERDERDARVNPFEPAPGAVRLDTGRLDPAETIEAAIAVIRERMPELPPGDEDGR
jgi:CMP/dCMP kinase